MSKRGRRFRLGHHWITDDRTGIAHWNDQMVRQWDGLYVKKGSEETRHPQEFVRSKNDPFAVLDIRPELGITFDNICGFYRMEFVPNTTIRRVFSIADDLLPLPGIGQMAIGSTANDCGHWFVVQEKTEFITVPSVFASNTSFSVPNTSHIINLPEGTSPGSRLIVCVSSEDAVSFTWPSGWVELRSSSNTTVSLSVAFKDVDGTEGFLGTDDIITVTTDLMKSTAHISYIITDYDKFVSPKISAGDTGSDISPNPDGLSPGFGDRPYLSIAVEAHNTASIDTTGIPSSYSNQIKSRVN